MELVARVHDSVSASSTPSSNSTGRKSVLNQIAAFLASGFILYIGECLADSVGFVNA